MTKLMIRCHFTANDLYCTARSGHVVVVRDYKTAFAAPEEKRDEVVASHTILLDITTPAELLTTSKDRVVISTVSQYYQGMHAKLIKLVKSSHYPRSRHITVSSFHASNQACAIQCHPLDMLRWGTYGCMRSGRPVEYLSYILGFRGEFIRRNQRSH
jgi:hypothetical protein